MAAVLVIFAIIVIGFILFCVYFIFKQVQFVLVAVNLYKKMIKRQDAMIKILLDIRDQTKSFNQIEIIEPLETQPVIDRLPDDSMNENEGEGDDAGEESFAFCYHCGAEMKTKVNICPNCGKEIDNSQ